MFLGLNTPKLLLLAGFLSLQLSFFELNLVAHIGLKNAQFLKINFTLNFTVKVFIMPRYRYRFWANVTQRYAT